MMKNKYFHYTSSCIMRNTLSCIIEIFLLYNNKNIYCHYIFSYIMTINILIIHRLV